MTSALPLIPAIQAPGLLRDTTTPESVAREDLLIDTFVDLVAGLTSTGDSPELLQRLVERCVQMLAASSAGLILTEEGGQLAVVAASTAEQRVLELFELQSGEGPCLDCARGGQQVLVNDLRADTSRWPTWAPLALAGGVRSAYALPLRLGPVTFGALNLFGDRPGLLGPRDTRVGQALADVATMIVLSSRQVRRAEQLSSQLQTALDSRLVIEQAKGVIATALGISVDDAFKVLRGHSRAHNLRLTEVAADLTTGRLGSDSLGRRP